MGNNISNNIIGIIIYSSPNNTLSANNIYDNNFNLDIQAVSQEIKNNYPYVQKIDSSNKINGKPIYYLIGKKHLTIDGKDPKYSKGIGYLGLILCSNITVKNISIKDNGQGILLAGTNSSIITNSNFKENSIGIDVQNSNKNKIVRSNILENTSKGVIRFVYGINLERSFNNYILSNTISLNDIGVHCERSNGNTLHFNKIVNNMEYGIENVGPNSLDILLNWWGNNQPNFKKLTKGKVNNNRWIVLNIHAIPNKINIGGKSKITAELLHDNKGTYHNPSNGIIPGNGLAMFKTTKGTVKSSNFTNGVAHSVLENLNSTGIALVSTIIDHQTVFTKVQINSVSLKQLIILAANIKEYYQKKHTLTSNVIVLGEKISMPQSLQLLVRGILNLERNNLHKIPIIPVKSPTKLINNINIGKIYKTEYQTIAKYTNLFIIKKERAPNYAYYKNDILSFGNLVYMFSKIINFYGIHNRLPNYVNI